jgi:branched-chain amino acid transport system permease protein
MDASILLQYVLSGLVLGVIYLLMAMGITFVYSIMKMINWAMGEFYMIGAYIQFFLVTSILGVSYWYVAVLTSIALVFVGGMVYERVFLQPAAKKIERKDDYFIVLTLLTSIFLRNFAIFLSGPLYRSVPDYFPSVYLLNLPLNGSRLMAFIGTILIVTLFYIGIKKTWIGKALQSTAQNRTAALIAGVDPSKMDLLAFGTGAALAGAAGALLAPVFLVYPTVGQTATLKGFEIVVIGGLGSIKGAVVGGILLGMVEILGAVFISSSYIDMYGFVLLLAILAIRPRGLFGEKKRLV